MSVDEQLQALSKTESIDAQNSTEEESFHASVDKEENVDPVNCVCDVRREV